MKCEEGNENEKEKKKKTPGRPKGKAKGKAAAKAKANASKAKAKAKAKSKAKKTSPAREFKEAPEEEVQEEEENEDEEVASDGAEHEEGEVAPGPTKRVRKASAITQKSGTSKPEAKKRAKKDKTQETERSGLKEEPVENDGLKGEKKECKEANRKPTKRKVGGAPSTFARRAEPTSEFGRLKWNALRGAFNEVIKPHLTHYSAAEAPQG